jgi:hypothetical protein
MNTKKLIGFLCWLGAFAIPFHSALLSTEKVNNIQGLIAFVVFVVLVFTGYLLVDGSGSKSTESHGH